MITSGWILVFEVSIEPYWSAKHDRIFESSATAFLVAKIGTKRFIQIQGALVPQLVYFIVGRQIFFSNIETNIQLCYKFRRNRYKGRQIWWEINKRRGESVKKIC